MFRFFCVLFLIAFLATVIAAVPNPQQAADETAMALTAMVKEIQSKVRADAKKMTDRHLQKLQTGQTSQGTSDPCMAAYMVLMTFGGGSFVPFCTSSLPAMTATDFQCLEAVAPGIGKLLNAFCVKDSTGHLCIADLEKMGECDSYYYRSTNCTTNPRCRQNFKDYRCETRMSKEMFTSMCGPCIPLLLNALVSAMPPGASTSDMDMGPVNDMLGAMCVKEPAGNLCINVIYDAGGNASTWDQTETGGIEVGLPNAAIDKICTSTTIMTCYRQLTGGVFGLAVTMAQDEHKQCVSECDEYYPTSTTCKPRCEAPLQKAKSELGEGAHIARTMCVKDTSGVYCFSKPVGMSSTVLSCGDTLQKYGTCSSSCSSVFAQELGTWGCCPNIVFYNSSRVFGSCSGLSTVFATTACTIPSATAATTTWDKRMELVVTWAKVQGDAALAAKLLSACEQDVIARTGASPDSITNSQLVASGAAGTTAHRRLQTLAAGKTDFIFTISGASDAEAQAAATAFDTSVTNNAPMPAAKAVLVEANVITADQDPVEKAAGAATVASPIFAVLLTLALMFL